MTDLEQLINNVKSDLDVFDTTTRANILSLITTIKAQQINLDKNGVIWTEMGNTMIELRQQIEAQKEAIQLLKTHSESDAFWKLYERYEEKVWKCLGQNDLIDSLQKQLEVYKGQK